MMSCNVKQGIPLRSQKIIIFDSPDGTGKTNIARALANALKIPYFRMGSQHDNWRKGKFLDALRFDQTYLVEFLKQTKTDVVIDRAYPSEWVYSSVFGRSTDPELLGSIDREFARLGTYIVIPLRHDYTKSRKDEVVKEEHLPVLHNKYLQFTKWTRCSTITMFVDAFQNNIDKQLPLLMDELQFGDNLRLSTNVIIDAPRPEVKDNSDLFDTLIAHRELEIK